MTFTILPDGSIVPTEPQSNQRAFRRAEVPPPPNDPEMKAAWIEYVRTLNKQEKMEVRRMQMDTARQKVGLKHQEVGLYMTGLTELREALGQPQVAEIQPAIGDRHILNPGFDDINRGLIQLRYIKLYDEYVRTTFDIGTSEQKPPMG